MKKIISTSFIALMISIFAIDTINAARRVSDSEEMSVVQGSRTAVKRGPQVRKRATGGRKRSKARGKKVAGEIIDNARQVQIELEKSKASNDPQVQEAARATANQLAKDLLTQLEDRTWAGDLGISKYTDAQVAAAAQKYRDLAVQQQQLEIDIKTKQEELSALSARSMLFWSKAQAGKEGDFKLASEQLKEMKQTLREVNNAMRNQAVIAGKEYCATVRLAIGALTAASVAGLAYGIDKYGYEGAGMKATGEFVGKERALLTEKGVRSYAAQRAGDIYGYGKGKVSDLSTYASDKVSAIKEYVGSYFGANKPANIKTAEMKAINEQQKADTLQDKADQTGSPADQTKADAQQEKADNAVANLETKVEAAQ